MCEKPVVVEGHYAQDVVPDKFVSLIFVLRKAPWRLKEIFEERGYNKKKVEENVEAEILDVCLVEAVESYGGERVCEIDTTSRNSDEIVEEILSIMKGGSPCVRGLVDWLGHESSKMLM